MWLPQNKSFTAISDNFIGKFSHIQVLVNESKQANKQTRKQENKKDTNKKNK
jgi:hypothetical protein